MNNFKKLVFALLVAFAFTATAFVAETKVNTPVDNNLSDFCDGWKDGYCEGYRDVKGQFAICPIAPLCPLPYVNQNRYKDGYNRGFKKGTGDAQR